MPRSAEVLVNWAPQIVRAFGTGERAPLRAAFDGALQRLHADATLSRADREAFEKRQKDLLAQEIATQR